MRLLAPRDDFDSVRPETLDEVVGGRAGMRKPSSGGIHDRFSRRRAIREPAPDRGRAWIRLRCTRAITPAPVRGRGLRSRRGIAHLEFQGQRAPGYDHGPGPGLKAERAKRNCALGVPGATSPAMTTAPVRGRGRRESKRNCALGVPGATSPWLLTTAPVRGRGLRESKRNCDLEFQGQRAPGY